MKGKVGENMIENLSNRKHTRNMLRLICEVDTANISQRYQKAMVGQGKFRIATCKKKESRVLFTTHGILIVMEEL